MVVEIFMKIEVDVSWINSFNVYFGSTRILFVTNAFTFMRTHFDECFYFLKSVFGCSDNLKKQILMNGIFALTKPGRYTNSFDELLFEISYAMVSIICTT